METGTAYKNYLSSVQNLETTQGRKNMQKPFAEGFKAIYDEVISADITLENAKSFLESLSMSELSTIQNYAGLADAIDVTTLSEEGAYNLLMHDNERYDFNADGLIQVGKANTIPAVPLNMPSDVREAFVTAMNSLDDKDKLGAMLLTFDTNRLTASMTGKPYTPQMMDYTFFNNRVDQLLNPKPPAITSEATKTSIRTFWDAFEQSYTGNRDVETTQERDPAIEKFLSDLRSKGAMQFLADLNKEKIEEKVEEFRQKLIQEMGDSSEAMIEIEERVSAFRKQLLEELQASIDSSDKTLPINAQAMIQTLLDMKENDTAKPLVELLHET